MAIDFRKFLFGEIKPIRIPQPKIKIPDIKIPRDIQIRAKLDLEKIKQAEKGGNFNRRFLV
jgi:hypothetical protein